MSDAHSSSSPKISRAIAETSKPSASREGRANCGRGQGSPPPLGQAGSGQLRQEPPKSARARGVRLSISSSRASSSERAAPYARSVSVFGSAPGGISGIVISVIKSSHEVPGSSSCGGSAKNGGQAHIFPKFGHARQSSRNLSASRNFAASSDAGISQVRVFAPEMFTAPKKAASEPRRKTFVRKRRIGRDFLFNLLPANLLNLRFAPASAGGAERLKFLKKNIDAQIYKMHLLSLSIKNARQLAAFLVTPR